MRQLRPASGRGGPDLYPPGSDHPDSDSLDSDHPSTYGRVMTSLPQPAAWPGPLPEASPPPGMAIYQLPTGTYDTRAAFAVKGGSCRDNVHFAATASRLQHPRGDVLIDAGFGWHVAAQIAALPRIARAPYQAAKTV